VSYRVELRPAALRDFKHLPLDTQRRIRPAVDRLAANPRPPGAEKLAAQVNRYRIRVGDHRVVYEIRDEVLLIMVIRIAHRREAYR
jgi:mRNA interferase RelE/StbE